MTAASTGSAASVGPRPQLLTLAAILLGVTAVLGMLLPLSLYADRAYVGCSIAVSSANATPTATVSGTPTPQPAVTPRATTNAEVSNQITGCLDGSGPVAQASDGDTSSVLARQLLTGVLPLVVLGGIAFFALRGVPLVRWFVVGLWVISNFIPLIPFSVLQLTGLFSGGLPVIFRVVFVLGIITFTAAAVLVNLRPVTTYFNAKRPVRTATAGGAGGRPAGGGGLFGSLLRPRPPAGGSTGTTGSRPVSMDKSTPTTPAATRPPKSKGGGGSGNTGRAKGKRRG